VGVQCLRLGQQQRELLAAKPAHEIVLTEEDRQGTSNRAECTVSG
jgi:hypothetical protein